MSETKEQTCSYCGEPYPAPIEYHHDTTECDANTARTMSEPKEHIFHGPWKHLSYGVDAVCEKCRRTAIEIVNDQSRRIEASNARIARMEGALREDHSLLQSALSIAGREGVQTNWSAFAGQVRKAIEAAHPLVYDTALADATLDEMDKEEANHG